MAVKRIIGKTNAKYKTCLSCGAGITDRLRDNTVYTCPKCGQGHFIDIYRDCLALTITERPDVRKRHIQEAAPKKPNTWEQNYKAWLDELAGLPDDELEREYGYMPEDMKRSVKEYIERVRV